MKASALFMEAAKRLAEGTECYCCLAIRRITGLSTKHADDAFEAVFDPKDGRVIWFGECSHNDKRNGRRNGNTRTLAMLFMHQIALDDERKKRRLPQSRRPAPHKD